VGAFSEWQPLYAERGIPTFPVDIAGKNKKPTIRYYMKVGYPASSQLVLKFGDADALGFVLGRRSRITVLDIDTPDERVLADGLVRYGKTPVIIRTGSGNYQAWYKHDGETRRIRPLPGQPIDILGGGFVVAPPSRGANANYQYIEGGLDDLANLPTMRHAPDTAHSKAPEKTPQGVGTRNIELWKTCMREARYCDNLESLLDVARTQNAIYAVPLADAEVVKTASSAWGYEQRGENRFGHAGAWLPQSHVNALVSDPILFALIGWLKAANRPNARFMVADGLCSPKHLNWPISRLRQARRRAIETGWIVKIRHESKGVAALYRWGPQAKHAK
jgi:hypothetical protein